MRSAGLPFDTRAKLGERTLFDEAIVAQPHMFCQECMGSKPETCVHLMERTLCDIVTFVDTKTCYHTCDLCTSNPILALIEMRGRNSDCRHTPRLSRIWSVGLLREIPVHSVKETADCDRMT